MARRAPSPVPRRAITTTALSVVGMLALAGCADLLGGDVPAVRLQEAAGVRWLSADRPWEQPEGESSALVTGPLELTAQGCLAVGPDTSAEAAALGPTLIALPRAAVSLENGRLVEVTADGHTYRAGEPRGFTGTLVPADELSREVRDAVATCGAGEQVLVLGPLG